MQAFMTFQEIEDEILEIDREWEELRGGYRPGAVDNKVGDWGYPTDRDKRNDLVTRIHRLFEGLHGYSEEVDVRDEYDRLRGVILTHFLFAFQNFMGLETDPFNGVQSDAESEQQWQRNLHFGQLEAFARATRAPEMFHDREDGSMQAVDQRYQFAAEKLGPCNATFVKLVEQVFYPLFHEHAEAYNAVEYYNDGLPLFFQSAETALIIINSPAIGQGGAHYEWMTFRRARHAYWIEMKERTYGYYSDPPDWPSLRAIHQGRLATHDFVLNNRRVQAAAATAQRNPSRSAAILVLEDLKDRLRYTARPFWATLSLYYRQWCYGTPRYAAPSTSERARAGAASVLAAELERLMKIHGRADEVVKLAQPLIEQLHAPSSALSFRDVRQWEDRADEEMENKRGRDEQNPYDYAGNKKQREAEMFLAFALAASDAGLAIEAPALVAATGHVLPRGGSIVDAAFAAHARARARAGDRV